MTIVIWRKQKKELFLVLLFYSFQHIVIIPDRSSTPSASTSQGQPQSATPSGGGESGTGATNPPTTANQSAQTRSVRFDRRRPQTLELRRGSSRSYIGNCAEVDTYLL